jgi:uncharacterized protein
MKKSQNKIIIIKSENGNKYLLSRNIPQVLLLHPVLNYMVELDNENINIEDWINDLDSEEIIIENNIKATKKELIYYYKYYRFLQENNYFKKIKKYEITGNEFTAEKIKFQLANTEQIVLEVTDACNLRCKYCGYGGLYTGYDKRENKNLSIKTAKNILDYLICLIESPLNRKINKKIIVSFYGGEPLLNMHFIKEIVEYAKSKRLAHNEFLFSMTTNGTLIDKHMDFLARNNFLLLISLDGDERSNAYRVFPNGKPAFKIIYNNISKLKNKYPEYFEKSVNFISVLHNKNHTKELYRYFKENFNKRPLISELSMIGIRPDKEAEFYKIYNKMYSDLSHKDLEEYRRDKNKILDTPFAKKLERFMHTHSGFVFGKFDQLLFQYENNIYVRTGTCPPFEKKIFITVNGKILPCEKISQTYFLGEVDNDNININFQKIADKYNNYYKKMSGLCNNCWNSDGCLQCIFHLNINDDKPECDEFMSYEKFVKQLSKSISLIEETPLYYTRLMKDSQFAQ